MPIHKTFTRAAEFGLEMELLQREMDSRRARAVFSDTARGRATTVARAAFKAGFKSFGSYWVARRLTVSLQVRLFVEAVMFSMGKPWSELVSGFKPLRMDLDNWK